MDKRFWAIIGIIIVVFGGIILINNHQSGTTSSSNTKPTSHFEGDLTSKVTLTEYGDYQCPVCENYSQAVQQVQQKYNDTIRFQFRNLPLLQIHPNAFAAARAAEAAALQGKFWQMHDTLYASQNYTEWAYDTASGDVSSADPTSYFKAYAKDLGLNVTKFTKDYQSAKVNNLINADIAAFKKTGQEEATPTFFINGKYYPNSDFVDSSGTPSVDAFSKVLDKVLKKNS